MKKALVALVMIALLVCLCACSVPSNSFMSKAQVNSLLKRYPEPKAVVTLSYKAGNDEFDVSITYKLLLEQAPIAVTRFIQIANKEENGYNNTLVDTLNTSDKYMIMGRYEQKEDNKYYNVRTADVNFAGEFKSNDYREPQGGYAEFKMFSLAMYHENDGEHFNSANGTLILALSSEILLNSANYAVFAEFESISVSTNGGEAKSYSKVPSIIRDHLMGFTTRTTYSIYDANDENAGSVSAQIMSTKVTLNVEVFGSDDNWKKLPTIR